MITHEFDGANVHATPPAGLEEMVGSVYGFHNGASWVTAWKPTAEDLAILNAGGSIYATVLTGTLEDGRPIIPPMFVGTEDSVLQVVSDTGKVWK